MAALSDIPTVLRNVGAWTFAKRLWKEMSDDDLFTWACALAYSWLFAVFPFFIFLLSLAPYLPERTKGKAQQEIGEYVYQVMPKQAADALWANLGEVLHDHRGGLLSLGLVLTLWAASGGMNMTMAALDRVYDVQESRPFYYKRALAIGLTVIVATLILVVLILLPIGGLAMDWVQRRNFVYISRGLLIAWDVARYSLAVVLMFAVAASVYHFGPSIRQKFRPVTPGAVFAVTIWILLGVFFRFYINKYGKYDQTYGTVGGVAILLSLFYLNALVLLIGAEINSEVDFEVLNVPRGSHDFRKAPEPLLIDPAKLDEPAAVEEKKADGA